MVVVVNLAAPYGLGVKGGCFGRRTCNTRVEGLAVPDDHQRAARLFKGASSHWVDR